VFNISASQYLFRRRYRVTANVFYKRLYHQIEYKGSVFGIAEYVSTKRSKSFKEKKNTLRHEYNKVKMIDVVAVLGGYNKNTIRYGDVCCYSSNEISNLICKIKNQVDV